VADREVPRPKASAADATPARYRIVFRDSAALAGAWNAVAASAAAR